MKKLLPPLSRDLLESAIKQLETHMLSADELVLMAYNLGHIDGRMEQLDRSEAMFLEEFVNRYSDAMIRKDKEHISKLEHDLSTRGTRLRPGS